MPDSIALLYALQEAADALEAKMAAIVSEVDLTVSQFNLLFYVVEQGPLRQTQLARYRRCLKSNVSNLVRAMEIQGLVDVQAAPDDRRARLVAPTAEGRKRYLKARRSATRLQKELTEHLGRSKSELLTHLSMSAARAIDANS
ncbi:MAG: MarR family winged helix-turn-helix transcriptional regulator [Myxococcota bacterium]